MTKAELEKEADDWVKEKIKEKDFGHFPVDCVEAYLASAEPREKQIQIDAEQIRALQKQNGELTDELKTLRESVKNYGAGCYENGLRNGRRKVLTEAKEIIKKFLLWENGWHKKTESKYELLKQAEAFLNSEVAK